MAPKGKLKSKEPSSKANQIDHYFKTKLDKKERNFKPQSQIVLLPKTSGLKKSEKLRNSPTDELSTPKDSRLSLNPSTSYSSGLSKSSKRRNSNSAEKFEKRKRHSSNRDSLDSLRRSLNACVKEKPETTNFTSIFGDFEEEDEELERLAKDNLGKLCHFPSDDEDGNVSSLNASQSSYDPKNTAFNLRAKEWAQSSQMQDWMERDILNIKIDYIGLKNLCQAESVGIISNEKKVSYLKTVELSPLELLFLFSPTYRMRTWLLSTFFNTYSAENRYKTNFDEIRKILHFILQLDYTKQSNNTDVMEKPIVLNEDTMQQETSLLSSHNSSCSFIASDDITNQLYEVSKRFFPSRRAHSNREDALKTDGFIDWRNYRAELCLVNLETFCSIILFVNVNEWDPDDICSLFYELCIVYLDEMVVELRAKLCATLEMIYYALDLEKAKVVVAMLTEQLVSIDADLRNIYLIFAMMTRLEFLAEHCVEFLRAIYTKILTMLSVSPSPDEGTYRSENNNQTDSPTKMEISESSIAQLFSMLPNVNQLLTSRPTDQYMVMQLLDLCITNKMIFKESFETLSKMNESLKTSRAYTETMSRLDDVVMDSMSSVGHRIGMVIHKRRAMAYETADMREYSVYSSSSEEDDN